MSKKSVFSWQIIEFLSDLLEFFKNLLEFFGLFGVFFRNVQKKPEKKCNFISVVKFNKRIPAYRFSLNSSSKPGSTLGGIWSVRACRALVSKSFWTLSRSRSSWELLVLDHEAQEEDFRIIVPSGCSTHPVELETWSPVRKTRNFTFQFWPAQLQ